MSKQYRQQSLGMLSEEDPEERLSPLPENIRVPVVYSFRHERFAKGDCKLIPLY